MQVKVLGSAAGGGFPQWNCACSNCARLRSGILHGRARTQSQIAVREPGSSWCLINASPDLRTQVLSDSDFHPEKGPRHSPIAVVVLTGPEIDQVMGLLHLREFQPLRIYATAHVTRLLREYNSLYAALERVPGQAIWTPIWPQQPFEPAAADGVGLNLRLEGLPLGGGATHDASALQELDDRALGLFIEGRSGRRMFCAPALPRLNASLLDSLEACEVILIDGTFWSNDELGRVRRTGKTAREMGHIPISGSAGTLAGLAKLKRPRKIFLHVNNTNPILDEGSPEYRQVIDAGCEIAHDGMEFEL